MSGELVAAQTFVVYAASDPVIHFHDSSDFNKEALIEWHRIKFSDGWNANRGRRSLVGSPSYQLPIVPSCRKRRYDESLAVPTSWGLTAFRISYAKVK